jgi:hypothetical protein
MSGGARLGAFGWATHEVYEEGRESKRRPFVIVLEHAGRFAVIFGRSTPRPNQPFEAISDKGELGRRMGLTCPTHFQAGEMGRLPADYEVRGYFATRLEDAGDPDGLADYALWIKLRALNG